MWKYRRLFGEDGMKRTHATNNRFNRILGCVRRWENRITIRESRKGVKSLENVAETTENSIKIRKRTFSPEVIEKKARCFRA